MQVEQSQYAKNKKRRTDMLEKDIDVIEDADLNKNKTITKKDEVKVVGEYSRSL